MVNAIPFRMMVPGTEEMGDPPVNYPQKVYLWKLSFYIEKDELRFIYDEMAVKELGAGATFETFEQFLGSVVDGVDPGWGPADDVNQPGETPLSISCEDYAYMVFVLTDRRWRFSTTGSPFMVESDKGGYYRMARCAWRKGFTGELKIEPFGNDDPDSVVAFFIADAESDQQDNPMNARSSFNIYLELIMHRNNDKPRFLPIVIDPDVGYPEGTGSG